MRLPNKQTIESFFYKLALLVGGIACLFAVFNGYGYLMIIFRTAFSFFFIYYLGKILMGLWNKITPKKRLDYHTTIDVILGDHSSEGKQNEVALKEEGEEKTSKENKVLTEAYAGVIPGQINADMKNGLQDSELKDELGKKMGLEKE